jgi:eukaryotic-like serine/threonine-protein kinase
MTWLSDDAVAHLRAVADEPDFSATRYRLVRELARGGMGVVYEADDLELRRRVAIKVLATEIASQESEERMRAEARVIAQLEHPGIVPLHDSGTLPDGRVFYAMKLVRGRTFSDIAAPSTEVLRLFLRVCETVAFAHARGVIHCDLKPSNVMVGEFGEVLVMDWGVARSLNAGADTGMPAVIGTRGFMSPEQERGLALDATTDVFALGELLRTLVTPPLSRRLAAIIGKATAPDSLARYPNARELASDIARCVDGQPVAAYRESVVERFGCWLERNRALVAVVIAYLVMRAVVLLLTHR